jgi:signal peptidase I
MRSSPLRWPFIIVLVLGVLLGVGRAVAIRWWRVPSGDPWLEASIAPTLRGGDLVVLWRLTAPHEGDLVLCPEPKHPTRVVIGRIAAQGGDRLDIEGQQLRLNGHLVPTDQSCLEDHFTTLDPQTHLPVEQGCDLEKLGSRIHMRGSVTGTPAEPFTMTVEPDHLFLVSDNRQLSYDSRDFGTVEAASCKETVFLRLVGKGGFSDSKSRLTPIR